MWKIHQNSQFMGTFPIETHKSANFLTHGQISWVFSTEDTWTFPQKQTQMKTKQAFFFIVEEMLEMCAFACACMRLFCMYGIT